MKKSLLPLLLILTLIPSAAWALEIIEGTEGSDLIFGDLEDFRGAPSGGSENVWQELNKLDDMELSVIGRGLEERIEGHLDNGDLILGLGGNDVIFGQGGNDRINGGQGEDIVFAGSGNDIIIWDPADRFVDGGSGLDILVCGSDAPSLPEILGNGKIRSIEILFRCNSWTSDKEVPGLSISNGQIALDPAIWQPSGRDTEIASYVSPDGKMSLEILSRLEP